MGTLNHTSNLKLQYLVFALLSLVFVATSIELAYAQNNVITASAGNVSQPVTPTANSTQTIARLAPFQGQFIKIFSVNSFVNEEQWRQLDDLTSQGYEIKAVLPTPSHSYVVVMQKMPGP